jgi:hypothetical protein
MTAPLGPQPPHAGILLSAQLRNTRPGWSPLDHWCGDRFTCRSPDEFF